MAKQTENRSTASFLVGHNSVGKPVFEEVLVDRLPGGRLHIVASPGVVLGAAAGDEVTLNPDGTFRVEKRGMNVAVQVYGRAEFADEVLPELWALDGSFDGRATVGPNHSLLFKRGRDRARPLCRQRHNARGGQKNWAAVTWVLNCPTSTLPR